MDLKRKAQLWLSQTAIPLWLERGVDLKDGGFFEELTLSGEPVSCPKRSMVQARQIYCFSLAKQTRAAEHGTKFLLERCSLPSGAFRHSVRSNGQPCDDTPDLYAQAFGIFGLAYANQRTRALEVLTYLNAERRLPAGGYTELHAGKPVYQSNPHMHLFEAALAWLDLNPKDSDWRRLADEIAELCLTRFIDPATGALAEHFDSQWAILREEGRFVFEPGHQYEWAWLLGRYEALTGKDLKRVRTRLFDLAEKHGICPTRRSAYDEVWSDFTPKKKSSRFWPQCERIKAAVQLGSHEAADEAVSVLMRYFETKVPGLWFDRWTEAGDFIQQPAKASSLYHILGALSEYVRAGVPR